MVEEDAFHVKWKNFSQTFLSNVSEMYDDTALTDITLVAGHGLREEDKVHTFQAHKFVLSVGSVYLKRVSIPNYNNE